MNRKLISLLIAGSLLFLVGAPVFATGFPDYDNIINAGGNGGATGVKPPVEILKVRFSTCGLSTTGISSGDIVAWDTNSSDGVSIVKMAAGREFAFAGVAVTAIATSDSTTLQANDKSWGYIAVKGFCIASIDYLVPAGRALCVDTNFLGLMSNDNSLSSQDVGIMLEATTGATKAKILLR